MTGESRSATPKRRFGRWAVVAAFGAIAHSGCSRQPPAPPPVGPAAAAPSSAVPAAGPAVPDDPPAPPKAKDWYVPDKADFRPEYDRDAVNRARESWDEYWSWVSRFYAGNFFAGGWTKQSADLLDGVRAVEARDELRAALNALGRRAAAEWSKDNAVRRLDTDDLFAFGRRLRQAKSDDDGSGNTLRSVINAVRAEVEIKLGRP